MQALLERLFKLEEHETRVSTEVLAGLTTFITMAYIIFVNPQMMASAGMDLGASFAATCLAAALACVFMGLYANWPVGLAPGMGLNAFFTYTVVGEMGYSWQVALGAVFIAGMTPAKSIAKSTPPFVNSLISSIVSLFLLSKQ